ncbi:MAG: response regulator [Oculatellaceae cyanobacterium Prado106]|jgi:CheY-like chemotaxis protein|nr:response regulator [Oculatellaceae cyanobacterium Prado106]
MIQTPVQTAQLSLLVIEDSDEDFVAFERIARRSAIPNPIYRCSDGDEALEFLYQTGEYADASLAPRPAMILLDLNLPGTDGREVLRQIKQNEILKTIPIVVFTTSSNPKDVEVCYQQGVNGYLIKPIDVHQLRRTVQIFFEYWFKMSLIPAGTYPT